MANKNWMAEAMVRYANEYTNMDVEKFEVPDYLKEHHPDFTREQYIAQYKADTLRTIINLALSQVSVLGEKLLDEVVDSVKGFPEITKLVNDYYLRKRND
jgi:putative heme iron utilization protein